MRTDRHESARMGIGKTSPTQAKIHTTRSELAFFRCHVSQRTRQHTRTLQSKGYLASAMGVCSFACFLRLCYNNLLSANTGHTRKTCTRDRHQGKHHLQTGYCGAYPEPYTQKHLQNHYKPSSLWARLPCHHTRPHQQGRLVVLGVAGRSGWPTWSLLGTQPSPQRVRQTVFRP